MQDILDQLITPEVRMVLYLMLACVVMLYVLSIVYVIRDAQRRGAEPWWLWAIISVIPIVGLLAFLGLGRPICRPFSSCSGTLLTLLRLERAPRMNWAETHLMRSVCPCWRFDAPD